jgi:TPP-dependent pyruvate/acetoin dehydrogenase alpha subunit
VRIGAATVDAQSEEALYLELYRRMWLIRRFEDEVQALFLKSLVHGTTHLCSGQEAGCVGVASVLSQADRVSCSAAPPASTPGAPAR